MKEFATILAKESTYAYAMNGGMDEAAMVKCSLIPASSSSSSSLSIKCALRGSGGRTGYEPTKMNRDHFWRSISRETNVEVSALSPFATEP